MLQVVLGARPKHESVSLVTIKTSALLVIPESGLVQEDIMMTPTRVETRQYTYQIMDTNTSKPCATSWCSDKESKNKRFKRTD